MRTRHSSFLALLLTAYISHAQVAINSTAANPDNSAMLDITSTTKRVLIPRMTTAERTAIASPATGLLVYDNTLSLFYYYTGSAWAPIATTGTAWSTIGNSGTPAGTNFIGATDNQSFDIRTNNIIHTRIRTTGQIEVFNTGSSVYLGDIGTTTPSSTLEVTGAASMAIKSGLVAGTDNPDNTASVWRYTSGAGSITLPDVQAVGIRGGNRRHTHYIIL